MPLPMNGSDGLAQRMTATGTDPGAPRALPTLCSRESPLRRGALITDASDDF